VEQAVNQLFYGRKGVLVATVSAQVPLGNLMERETGALDDPNEFLGTTLNELRAQFDRTAKDRIEYRVNPPSETGPGFAENDASTRLRETTGGS
jgi:hypothetical protein